MNQPERKQPPAMDDARSRRVVRLAHANAVLREIASVGSNLFKAHSGAVARLRVTTDGRVFFRDSNPDTPDINLHDKGNGPQSLWPNFPYLGSEALLLRGLRDYVTNGTKIHQTLIIPRVNGVLARAYTDADVSHIVERLRFVPILVTKARAAA